MKKLFYSLMIMASVLAVSCNKNDKPDGSKDPSKDAPSADPSDNPDDGTISIDEIYIYGSATEFGWDLSKAEAFTDNGGGLYSWQGYLEAGAPFRFPLQKSADWPALMVDEDGETIILGRSEADIVTYTLEVSGIYDVLIDARNSDQLTAALDLVEMDYSKLEIEHLYILGEATATGWSLDIMEELDNNDGLFTWEGPLKADKRFRFPLQKEPNVWWPCLMLGPDNKVLYGMGDADEVNTPVAEDGIYNVEIDTRDRSNMTWKVELKEAGLPEIEITELWMLGDATVTGWSIDDMEAFELVEGKFVWSGHLYGEPAAFRFMPQKRENGWFPAIVKVIETGESVYCENWDDTVYEMYTVPSEGDYTITVDASDIHNISVEIK